MNFHPPAPTPHRRPLNAVEFVWTMARNPLAIWSEAAYSEPVIVSEWLGNPTVIVSDPAAIRHVMVDNSKNYAMQPLRQRVLRPILRDGLLTAEGELWRRARRSLAPVFAPRNTTGLATAMLARSELFAEGLRKLAGSETDIATQMTLLTFDILQATLFTGDIAGDPEEFAAATASLLKTMGRVDPMDVLDAPAFVPRLTRLLGQKSQAYFRELIAATIERRQELMRKAPEQAPRDLLTLLLEAEGLSRNEVEDNIITFIGAGHETTARALGWTLYLLSQAPEERAKVEAEIDAHDFTDPNPAGWVEKLVYTRAAFEEAMRLYPPAPSLNRMAIDDDQVGKIKIPEGRLAAGDAVDRASPQKAVVAADRIRAVALPARQARCDRQVPVHPVWARTAGLHRAILCDAGRRHRAGGTDAAPALRLYGQQGARAGAKDHGAAGGRYRDADQPPLVPVSHFP